MKKLLAIILLFLYTNIVANTIRDPFIPQPDSQNTVTTQSVVLHYAKASDLIALLQNKNHHLLSSQGSATADPHANVLWLTDRAARLSQVTEFLRSIDQPVKQVTIAARVVNIDEDSLEELGISFHTHTVPSGGDKLHMDLPLAIANTGHFTLALAQLGDGMLLDLELAALEREGRAHIISSPKLTTLDRQVAVIESGEEIPYQEQTANGGTNVSFKKAVLSLKVKPEITAEDKILLNLAVNQDKVSTLSVNGAPAISTQQLQTQVLVADGQTIVLGGIYEESNNHVVEKIPLWSSIPGLGGLFRNKYVRTERKQLLIFVTPHIVR